MRQHLVPAIVLAGGQGARLYELTAHECKPALTFAGRHKIIDFALANARNSGFCNVLIATQYCPDTLHEHLYNNWLPEFQSSGGNLVVRHSGHHAYSGTAGAVFRNLPQLEALMPDHVLILAADHVYQMDYSDMLADHVESGADVTIAANVVPTSDARQFGIMRTNAAGRIVCFAEKPKRPTQIPGQPGQSLASMGIYIFKWPVLREALVLDAADAESSHDFGKDLLPRMIAAGHAQCHRFRSPVGGDAKPYWRDVGTLDSYLLANLEIMRDPSLLDFSTWPMLDQKTEAYCPTGLHRKSFISRDAVVDRKAVVHDSIVLPGAVIGRRAHLTNTIVVPGTRIPDGLIIGPDAPVSVNWFRRTLGGTCLVTQDMVDSFAVAGSLV
jgi:glucose-1-phosphate adenylyltransferase